VPHDAIANFRTDNCSGGGSANPESSPTIFTAMSAATLADRDAYATAPVTRATVDERKA
jgi:hypothetical protein